MSCIGHTTMKCGECGIEWEMADDWVERRHEDHKTWHCPNGHIRMFGGPSKKERRITELEAEVVRLEGAYAYMRNDRDEWRDVAEHEERRRTGYQGAYAKERKLRLMA